MIECRKCHGEFELLDHDILAVSSSRLEAVVLCPLCRQDFTEPMVMGKISGPREWSPRNK